MNWRPENWKDIKPQKQSRGVVDISEANFDYGVEAGADAMLEALLEALEKLAEESPTGTFTIDSRIKRR